MTVLCVCCTYREVQLHQHRVPSTSPTQHLTSYLSATLSSSFLLPFLMVLGVAMLLLCCHHRRRPYAPAPSSAPPLSPADASLHRSQSLNSLVKIHRRMSSAVGGSTLHMAEMGGIHPADSAEYGSGRRGGGGTLLPGSGVSKSGSKLKFIV